MPQVADSEDAIVVQPQTSLRQRLTIYAYLAILYFVIPFTGLWGTSASFLLKDRLLLPASTLALFSLVVAFPAYIGFIFGFIRDRWSPFGRRDQGILIICGCCALLLLLLGLTAKLTFVTLALIIVCSGILGQLRGAALRGLISVLGQEHLMSGRISAVWQAAAGLPGIVIDVWAGRIAKVDPSARLGFLISLGFAAAILPFMFWRPKEVYDAAENAPVKRKPMWPEVVRLFKTPALYPIVLLLFLWNFTPGVGTPFQYYLTNTLHGDPKDFGNFNAIFSGCFIPSFLLYGFLCTRVKSSRLIWACTFIAVPQILPLLTVHSARSALIAAVPMGLMGGPATAAYYDLLIRACPRGLQGTAMMLGASAWALSDQLGNLAGSYLWDYFKSFAPCAWTTVAVYACLIPVLACVPKGLLNKQEGKSS